MSEVHPNTIKQIAREIESGKICYIHKFTKAITTIDNSIDNQDMLNKQVELEKKIDSYVKVETPSQEDQLEMMEYFLEELPDKSIRKQLSNALKRKNPIRNFTQAVESDIELNIHWGNFRYEEYQRWISNLIIDAYNY